MDITPKHLTKVFYSEDGAEAVEIAIKMAYQYYVLRGDKGRTKFISVKEGYHGDTVGAMSVGGSELFHGVLSLYCLKAIMQILLTATDANTTTLKILMREMKKVVKWNV